MKPRLSLSLFAAFAAACTLSAPAVALQTIAAKDGASIAATISRHEPTRIRVEGAKITSVLGNIHSSTCKDKTDGTSAAAPGASSAPTNPLGEFVLGCDLAKGDVFIRPVIKEDRPGRPPRPISIFVTTDRATYTMLLTMGDALPADTIVIVDKTSKPTVGATGVAVPGKSAPHVRAVKAMLLALAGPAPASDYSVQEVNEAKLLWAEVTFEKVKIVTGNRLIGEQYMLTNVTKEPMVLAEQEFDQEGEGIVAVSIEQMNLRPGERTAVYVIRSGE